MWFLIILSVVAIFAYIISINKKTEDQQNANQTEDKRNILEKNKFNKATMEFIKTLNSTNLNTETVDVILNKINTYSMSSIWKIEKINSTLLKLLSENDQIQVNYLESNSLLVVSKIISENRSNLKSYFSVLGEFRDTDVDVNDQFILAYDVSEIPNSNIAKVYDFCVFSDVNSQFGPKLRRKGLGKFFAQQMEKKVKDLGFSGLQGEIASAITSENKEIVIQFWTSIGYQVQGISITKNI